MFDPHSNKTNSNLPIHHQSNPSNEFSHPEHHHHQQQHNPNPSYSYLNFPSHLLADDDLFLGAVLPYQPPPPPPPPPERPPDQEKGKRKRATKKAIKEGSGGSGGVVGGGGPKRRTGKKDRHSKIYTAHGPRDRRMRLSLQIARKFFDLQDLLGFDKASKTIEWLFNKSKAAIKDLSQKSCASMVPSSPPSEEETNEVEDEETSLNKRKIMGNNSSQVKEKREKARARARERTKEKKLMIMMQQGENKHTMEIMEQNPNCSRVGDQEEQRPLEEQMASVGIIEKFLATSSSSLSIDRFRVVGSSDPVMRYGDIDVDFVDFPGNWVT